MNPAAIPILQIPTLEWFVSAVVLFVPAALGGSLALSALWRFLRG